MKKLLVVLVMALALIGCIGSDGDNNPGDISGSWFGTGYVSGRYVELTSTFHPQGQGYYTIAQVFFSPRYGTQGQQWTVYYEGGIVYDADGILATVHSDYMEISIKMGVAGGFTVTGHITLYRQ